MTKLTRKLMISVFTLAFALVTLGASTFAWFTLTSVSTIDDLEMEIIAGNYMEISLNGKDFKNSFTSDEILAAVKDHMSLGENPLPKLDAVSTEDGVSFVKMDGTAAPNNSSIAFKIWFKSNEFGSKVYLGGDTQTSSTSKTWISDQVFKYRDAGDVAKNDPIAVFAADALRFSFEEYDGIYDDDEEVASHDDPVGVTIFELDSSKVGGQPTNLRLGHTLVTDRGLVKYWEAKTGVELALPTIIDDPDEETSHQFTLPANVKGNETLDSLDSTVVTTSFQITDNETGMSNYIGFAIVRIWIEGWDPDCFDAILNTKMEIRFAFKLESAS